MLTIQETETLKVLSLEGPLNSSELAARGCLWNTSHIFRLMEAGLIAQTKPVKARKFYITALGRQQLAAPSVRR